MKTHTFNALPLFLSVILFFSIIDKNFAVQQELKNIASGNIYFVSETGAGTKTGDSYDNRASIATHNAGEGVFSSLEGDTVILCGEFATPVIVPVSGTSTNWITYDGNASAYNAAAEDAIITSYSSESKQSGFCIYEKEYITVKNILVDWGYTEEMGTSMDNVWGIQVSKSNNILIESCTMSHVQNGMLISIESHDVEVIKCLIEEVAESGIYIYASDNSNYPHHITIGGSKENGNTLKNCTYKTKWDENRVSYDVRLSPFVSNVIISYNHMFADQPYHGMSGILAHSCRNLLIENNTIHNHDTFNHRAAISLKSEQPHQLVSNVIIRRNRIFNETSNDNSYTIPSHAIVISGNWEHVYIYGNNITNCGAGINVNYARWTSPSTHSDGINSHHMHIWSNIINETTSHGIVIDGYSGGTDMISDVYIINNTFNRVAYKTSVYDYAAISNRLPSSRISNVNIINNIIVDARVETSEPYAIYPEDEANFNCENNTIYYTTNPNPDYEPLFVDFKNNFALQQGSPMIDSGIVVFGPSVFHDSTVALGGVFDYQQTIDPYHTDWDVFPPEVNLVDQDDFGTSWERGACIFDEDNVSAPTELSAIPISLKQLELSWTDNSEDEDGFIIQRSNSGMKYITIDTVGINMTSFVDTGLVVASTYYYRVYTYNDQSNSVFSNYVMAEAGMPPLQIWLQLYFLSARLSWIGQITPCLKKGM